MASRGEIPLLTSTSERRVRSELLNSIWYSIRDRVKGARTEIFQLRDDGAYSNLKEPKPKNSIFVEWTINSSELEPSWLFSALYNSSRSATRSLVWEPFYVIRKKTFRC